MLSPKRLERHQPRASLLLPGVLLCVILATASASNPAAAHQKCPRHIDCAREGRHFCRPGSSHCGPCLTPLEENEEGKCEKKNRHRHREKVTSFPDVLDLDEEIDVLHAVIAKQQVAEFNEQPVSSPSPPAPPEQTTRRHRLRIQAQLNAVSSPSPPDPPEQTTRRHRLRIQAQLNAVSTPSPPAPPEETTRHHRLRIQAQLNAGQPANTTTTLPGPITLPDSTTQKPATGLVDGRSGPLIISARSRDGLVVIMISVCVLVGSVALVMAAVCWIRMQRESRLARKADYPAFGLPSAMVPGNNGISMGDQTLAQSAQMYHYQHQKQQMLSMGKQKAEQKPADSEVTSDEDEVGGDFTVYECPGLAPTGEMEVKNPLFDDSTPYTKYQENHK